MTPPIIPKESPPLKVSYEELKKQEFTTIMPAARVPLRKIGAFRKKFSSMLYNKPKKKKIYTPDENPVTYKLVLLRQEIPTQAKVEMSEWLTACDDSIKGDPIIDYDVKSYWTDLDHLDVLRRILPDEVCLPTSYEDVGSIIHFNLKPHHLPYKHVIGKVYLDFLKSSGKRIVVNKTESIANEFRVFPMEILAGDTDCLETEVKANGCSFRLNYSEVYWNTKLSTEHSRVIDMFPPGTRICDLCAGIGPFSIPLAKKGCTVHANDLNPRSVYWLKVNKKRNFVGLTVTNLDARECVRKLRAQGKDFDVFIMNLPGIALQLLDAFVGVYSQEEVAKREKMPTVLVYCFASSEETNLPFKAIKEQVCKSLGVLPQKMEIKRIRGISSETSMYRVELELPRKVACPSFRSPKRQRKI